MVQKSNDGTSEVLLAEAREEYQAAFQRILHSFDIIDQENIGSLEYSLRYKEIEIASKLIQELKKVQKPKISFPSFSRQADLESCVPVSLANALYFLGEKDLVGGSSSLEQFVEYFIESTGGETKTSRRRKLDDVLSFINKGWSDGISLNNNYRFRRTNSVIDIAYGLFMGQGAVLAGKSGHMEMAYGLISQNDDAIFVHMHDPMGHENKKIPLDEFANKYIFSPLGGISRRILPNQQYAPTRVAQLYNANKERNFYESGCTSGILEIRDFDVKLKLKN